MIIIWSLVLFVLGIILGIIFGCMFVYKTIVEDSKRVKSEQADKFNNYRGYRHRDDFLNDSED